MPQLRSGYVFEAPEHVQANYAVCGLPNEDWETVVYTCDGKEVFITTLFIDCTACRVFKCSDGRYRAATRVSTN